jgi:adenosylhomocysteine nucleosidase
MSPSRLLFLTAVLPEARALARAFSLATRSLARGGIAGPSSAFPGVHLANVGIRARNVAKVLAVVNPQLIVMTGLAGALSPHLQVGDIVLDGPPPLLPPVNCPAAFAIRQGTIHTVEGVIATAAQKAALFARTGALAVDMETRIVCDAARPLGIPVIGVRAISDAAHEPLDPRLLALLDDDGNPKLHLVGALLLRHPTALATLLHIKRATDAALANLGTFLVQAAMSGWPRLDTPSSSSTPQLSPSANFSKAL